jgi:hypothetical protein
MVQTPDYRKMTKTQLTALARRKKIPVKAGLLKEDLVTALKKGLRTIEAQKKTKQKVTTKKRKALGPAKKKSAKTSKTTRKTHPAKRKTTKTTAKKSATTIRKTARTKKTTPSAPVSQPLRTGLPDRYGDHRLVVLARDPNWAYVYWDLDPKRMRELAPGGESARWMLRVYDATLHPVKGAFFDVDINVKDGSYYLDLDRPGARFVVEIGVVDSSGWFHATAQSNPVILPRDHPSDTAASLGTASCRDGVPAFSNPRRPGPVKGP